MVQFELDGRIPDMGDHLIGLNDPTTLQEHIRQVVVAHRLADTVFHLFATPKEAVEALDTFIETLLPALEAVRAPPPVLDVPVDVQNATCRTMDRMIAAARKAREGIAPYLPSRGGQAAPRQLDITTYRVVELLKTRGAKNFYARAARILGACGIPVPTTAQGIAAIYRREQNRIPGRRVVRF